MADYLKLSPFILEAEGGYVNNPSDRGGETNKGITYATWVSFYGDTLDNRARFLAMDDDNWLHIFKTGFWDKCLADKIENQAIANMIVDWVWGSGQYFPELDVQKLINTLFSQRLAEDGIFGEATIASLNSCNQKVLYESLITRRRQYFNDIVAFTQSHNDHSQDKFLQGWLNRIDKLVKYNYEL